MESNLNQFDENYKLFSIKGDLRKNQIIYVLVKEDDQNKPLGKITLFDLNTRNHSAEFGYCKIFDVF